MSWIDNLLDRVDRGKRMELPCVVRLNEEQIEMELFEVPLPCGHPGYLVNLAYYVKERDESIAIAGLRDFNVEAAIHLLQRADEIIKRFQE